jgi:Lrp/AsnC family transcriptional regulator for asnA, asnC and gidA
VNDKDALALDELDLKIIEYLIEDGRTPYTQIAEELGITESTVRKRVSRMREDDIIKIRAITDPAKLGYTTEAIVGVQLDTKDLPRSLVVLKAFEEITHINVCAGIYDLVIEIRVKSNEDLFAFLTEKLRKTPGIAKTDTLLVLKTAKDRFMHY